MKKKLVALAAAVATLALSAVMLAGCSGGGDAQSADSAATDGSFTLAVGFDQGYPPYGYVGDDGQFTGFDLELAKAVCEKNGWELKLEPIDWDAKDALIGSGTINCIWNGFTMENRENDYTFSEPYMYNEQVVVVKKDGDAKKLEDLAGKTVLTQVDSAALHVLEDEKGQKALADTFKELQTAAAVRRIVRDTDRGTVLQLIHVLHAVRVNAHPHQDGGSHRNEISLLIRVEVLEERLMLIHIQVERLFSQGLIGAKVIREFDHLNLQAVLLGGLRGSLNHFSVRACRSADLDFSRLLRAARGEAARSGRGGGRNDRLQKNSLLHNAVPLFLINGFNSQRLRAPSFC